MEKLIVEIGIKLNENLFYYDKILKENGLENDIILCGKISDRYELSCYYKRADLFLFPSMYDSSSIVQIESASQSTPGLFIRGSVTATGISDNINGFLAENSLDSYSNRIIEIMEDEELYKKVALNSFRDIYINWEEKIEEVYNIYMEFINKK